MASNDINIRVGMIDQFSAKFKGLTGGIGRLGGMLQGLGLGIGAWQAVSWGKELFKTMSEDEKATHDLGVALEVMGNKVSGRKDQLDEFANSISKVTVFSNDAINKTMAMAIRMGAPIDKMEEFMKAAIGFAKRNDKSLEESVTILVRATQGMTAGLEKTGIQLTEGASEAERFSEIINKLSKYFRLATEELNTYDGKAQHLGNTIDELKSKIGEGLFRKQDIEAIDVILQHAKKSGVDIGDALRQGIFGSIGLGWMDSFNLIKEKYKAGTSFDVQPEILKPAAAIEDSPMVKAMKAEGTYNMWANTGTKTLDDVVAELAEIRANLVKAE